MHELTRLLVHALVFFPTLPPFGLLFLASRYASLPALVQDLLGSIPVCAGRRGCGWPVLSVARFPCVIGTGGVLCSTHCRQADWCSVTQMKYNYGKVTQRAHCGQAQLSKLRQVSALFIFFGDYSSQVHGC